MFMNSDEAAAMHKYKNQDVKTHHKSWVLELPLRVCLQARKIHVVNRQLDIFFNASRRSSFFQSTYIEMSRLSLYGKPVS
jgi:hypothetical protein